MEIENGIVSYEEIWVYSNSKPAFAEMMLQARNGWK